MSTIFGLGNGLPMSSRASSAERSGAHEGIEGFSAGSAVPVLTTGENRSETGTAKSQLSDAMQSVMLEFQEIGSGSSSFAAAMADVQGNDNGSDHQPVGDVFASSSKSETSEDDVLNAKKDADEEFRSALREANSVPVKDENRNEKAERQRQQDRQELEQAEQAATNLPEDVAGLDSRVTAQVLHGQQVRKSFGQNAMAA
ncbi:MULTISPECIES: hypothetical protein [Thalassospira]|uniref:Uncharacterized protein n=2 Tax=Thalassospira TaxID=168934 RepID=A0A367WCN2_9PROT|nr:MULTISPECIES: hypothetical protein [Thalassospira]MDG4719836.1 hypothetical protein [Thalassospira sp. FZY0004]RCK38282.1 hypothetical protein TH19_05620 [Thalassospira profundimaris]